VAGLDALIRTDLALAGRVISTLVKL
jgi:hypothetical protein